LQAGDARLQTGRHPEQVAQGISASTRTSVRCVGDHQFRVVDAEAIDEDLLSSCS
jgi:hypothetical protein